MSDIHVSAGGWLSLPGLRFPCALGRGGVTRDKSEGDGATPAGRWPLRALYYRADRLAAPRTRLPTSAIGRDWGWCDDPAHPDYNRRVLLPHPARCEALWRADALYDLVVALGYNDSPVTPGKGSAIFLHAARPNLTPTEGCVALERGDLQAVIAQAGPGDALIVAAR